LKQTGHPRKAGKRGKTRYKMAKHGVKASVNDLLADFNLNDKVQIVMDGSIHSGIPDKAYKGLSGTVTGKRGTAYEVTLLKGNEEKVVVTTPVHLKKIA